MVGIKMFSERDKRYLSILIGAVFILQQIVGFFFIERILEYNGIDVESNVAQFFINFSPLFAIIGITIGIFLVTWGLKGLKRKS